MKLFIIWPTDSIYNLPQGFYWTREAAEKALRPSQEISELYPHESGEWLVVGSEKEPGENE